MGHSRGMKCHDSLAVFQYIAVSDSLTSDVSISLSQYVFSDTGAPGDGRGQFHRLDGAANVSSAAPSARGPFAQLDSPFYAQSVHAGGICGLKNVRLDSHSLPTFAGIPILNFKFHYFCRFICSIHFEFCVKFTHRCLCSGTRRSGIRHRFRAAPLAASASSGGAWGGTGSTPGGGGADDASSASAAAFAAMAAAAAAPVSASAGELLQLRRETCEQLAIDSDDDLVRAMWRESAHQTMDRRMTPYAC
jgi:hypothetical protein